MSYFLAANAAPPSPTELRTFLGTQLPDYMLPAAFVRLEQFPATAHGKVDREKLPAPGPGDFPREDASPQPQSAVQQQIAQVLSSLLGLSNVGLDENFFLLGGHSLLGTQLIGKLRQIFGIDLSLRSLFAKPTIRALALEIEARIANLDKQAV